VPQSTGLVEIIAWRFVQGVGGGALLSTSQAILFDAFEPKDRPFASGLFGMGLVLGPTPDLLLADIYRTHELAMIFMINIPIGIVQRFLQLHLLIRNRVREKIKIKFILIIPVSALLMAGIGCLQYVFGKGEAEDGSAAWQFQSEFVRPLQSWE